VFPSNDAALIRLAGRIAGRLPGMCGEPVRLERRLGLKDQHGPVHAGSWVRERRIAFDCTAREAPRIFVHELFHFVWVRAGNARRWSYERLLDEELRSRTRGELGWSAEWRKGELTPRDVRRRTRRWREYCCESFCDTAAWLYSGIGRHPEFTLPQRCRKTRRQWFASEMESGPLSI
jgi:hypothetical protein